MQIYNNTTKNTPSFNAILYIRGNARGLTSQQITYFQKVASDIGISRFDKIDIFIHKTNQQKEYSLVDIGGYIYDKLKAAHKSYTNNQQPSKTVANVLKFLITKMYNNELLMQLENSFDINEFKNLKDFINSNKIQLKKSDAKTCITRDKLTIDGCNELLSEDEFSKLSNVVNSVAITPYDKFYMYVHPNDKRNRRLINMAGYVHGLLKTSISDYENEDVYNGCILGIKFAIEKLFAYQIRITAPQCLTKEKIEALNQTLEKEHINLRL